MAMKIVDVKSLESYLADNSARLGIEGQAMGRALYLSQKARGGLTLPEIAEVLDGFNISTITQVPWFCGMVEAIYAGMIRPDDIRSIIKQAIK